MISCYVEYQLAVLFLKVQLVKLIFDVPGNLQVVGMTHDRARLVSDATTARMKAEKAETYAAELSARNQQICEVRNPPFQVDARREAPATDCESTANDVKCCFAAPQLYNMTATDNPDRTAGHPCSVVCTCFEMSCTRILKSNLE